MEWKFLLVTLPSKTTTKSPKHQAKPRCKNMQTSQRGKTKTTAKKHVQKSDLINTPFQQSWWKPTLCNWVCAMKQQGGRVISSYGQNVDHFTANFCQFLLMCISLTNEIFQTLPVTRSRPFSCWRMLSTGDVLLCLARSTVLPRRQVRLREYSAHLSLISFQLKTKDKPAMHLKERNACYLDEGFHWNDMLLQVIADERKAGLQWCLRRR